jgi:hypothetical protein
MWALPTSGTLNLVIRLVGVDRLQKPVSNGAKGSSPGLPSFSKALLVCVSGWVKMRTSYARWTAMKEYHGLLGTHSQNTRDAS